MNTSKIQNFQHSYNGIYFDPQQLNNVVGVGMSAWDKFGVEKILPNYQVIYIKGLIYNEAMEPYLLKIAEKAEMREKTAKGIIKDPAVNAQVNFAEKRLLIYKNTHNIAILNRKLKYQILSSDGFLAEELENKAKFRNLLVESGCDFPEYQIISRAALGVNDFALYSDRFGKFVVQDVESSGGKGTFFVDQEAQFAQVLENLDQSGCEEVVISKFIEGDIVSIQACVTKFGTYYSPIQKQITYNPYLCDLSQTKSEKFCGGQWGYAEYSEETKEELKRFVSSIGQILFKRGYRGIFGLDFMIDRNGKIFIIEMNSRLTAFTAPLAMLANRNKKLSLMLLHVLELAGIEYQLSPELEKQHSLELGLEGGYLILHNLTGRTVSVDKALIPGVYTLSEEQKLIFLRPGYSFEDLENSDEFILVGIPAENTHVKPGKRIARILTLDRVLDQDANLLDRYHAIIKAISEYYIYSIDS